jgi:hypothetical protein
MGRSEREYREEKGRCGEKRRLWSREEREGKEAEKGGGERRGVEEINGRKVFKQISKVLVLC